MFSLKNIILDLLESTKNGRVLVYDQVTKKTKVIFLEKFIRYNNYYKREKGSTRDKQKSITFLRDGTFLKTSKIN